MKEYECCKIEIVYISQDVVTLSGVILPEDGLDDVGEF